MPPAETPVMEPKQVQAEPRDCRPAYRWTEDARIVREYRLGGRSSGSKGPP